MTGSCGICGDAAPKRVHGAREMMFGLRETFSYVECAACGCLALADPPPDLARFYPGDYYSFRPPASDPWLERWVKQKWAAHLLGRRNPVGALLSLSGRTRPPGIAAVAAVGLTGARPDCAVLDVGSGSYGVLHLLRDVGFTRLLGVDPYIDGDSGAGPELRIRRAHLHDVDGAYDLVVMNHSLEHMPDHAGVLRHVHRVLEPGGVLLVRTPVAAASWREFGTDWVELDAPRHLMVHTTTSMRTLAEACGFVVERVVHDSSAAELWGSLQYRMDIALTEPRSYGVDPAASPFSAREVRAMERRVRAMNRAGDSGRAAFVLRRC
jgi:SAM-dependent methyltransferase